MPCRPLHSAPRTAWSTVDNNCEHLRQVSVFCNQFSTIFLPHLFSSPTLEPATVANATETTTVQPPAEPTTTTAAQTPTTTINPTTTTTGEPSNGTEMTNITRELLVVSAIVLTQSVLATELRCNRLQLLHHVAVALDFAQQPRKQNQITQIQSDEA